MQRQNPPSNSLANKKNFFEEQAKKAAQSSSSSSSAKPRDAILSDAKRKEGFQTAKTKIINWTESLRVETRQKIMKKLNIDSIQKQKVTANTQTFYTPSVQTMTAESVKNPIKNNVEKKVATTKTFAEVFNLNQLLTDPLAIVPHGETIQEGDIYNKLDEFITIVKAINQGQFDQFIEFLSASEAYDERVVLLQTTQQANQLHLQQEFEEYQRRFVGQYEQLINRLVDGLTCLTEIIAYLENVPAAGVNIHVILKSQYEDEGHDAAYQFKVQLIERCSPTMRTTLHLNPSDNNSVLQMMSEFLLNQACEENNENRTLAFVPR